MTLTVTFDDGRRVLYDVKEDLNLPGYDALGANPGLFQNVQLDPSCTCVFWNDEIDLPSDAIYEYGKTILPARLSQVQHSPNFHERTKGAFHTEHGSLRE